MKSMTAYSFCLKNRSRRIRSGRMRRARTVVKLGLALPHGAQHGRQKGPIRRLGVATQTRTCLQWNLGWNATGVSVCTTRTCVLRPSSRDWREVACDARRDAFRGARQQLEAAIRTRRTIA